MNEIALNSEYVSWLQELKTKILNSQQKAVLHVNQELILLYYDIGKTIVEKQNETTWGSGIIEQLSKDLSKSMGQISGFSKSNLYAMRQFYLTFEKFHQPGGKTKPVSNTVSNLCVYLPWRHIVLVLQKVKTEAEIIYYLQKAIENNWSRNVLNLQIESNLFERKGKAIHNFEQVLPKLQADLLHETLKNPYNFDFLTLEKNVHEKHIEKGLISNISKFILELGKGFAFLGQQYPITYNSKDYFLDLLFYNVNLHCYVVIELKIGEFLPEYVGKLNFYINLVDATLKKEIDTPTIGILLCKGHEKFEVEFTLKDINKPIGVSEYRFNELPLEIQKEMPSVEELEQELKNFENNS